MPKKKVILCVDDEKFILTSIKGQLKAYFGDQFSYELAESADEAIDVIEELAEEGMSILVIVSDWLMPGVKGDEFLIEVHKRFPKIVNLMLTGQADDAAIENAKKHANLFCVIHKPWTSEELVDAIKKGIAVIESDKDKKA